MLVLCVERFDHKRNFSAAQVVVLGGVTELCLVRSLSTHVQAAVLGSFGGNGSLDSFVLLALDAGGVVLLCLFGQFSRNDAGFQRGDFLVEFGQFLNFF